jgi:hypothetical protein
MRRALLAGAGAGILLAAAGALGLQGAGASTALGGFTVTALAEASTFQYEQPNLPVPATPTFELDEGYAATSDNFGPTGSATASALYPGQVVANAGPELGTLAPGVPLPPAPTWPIQAQSTYPKTPANADDQPGVTMESASSAQGNTATSAMGPGQGATGSAGAATSGLGGIQSESGTSSSSATATLATATGTATDSGISLLGGLIKIGSVATTATATSDGTTGKVTGSTTVSNMTVSGQTATVDGSGLHIGAQGTPPNPLDSTLNTVLGQLGISFSVTAPTDTVNGPSAQRDVDGLHVVVNLTQLDAKAPLLTKYIPVQLLAQLPVPVPNKQTLEWDFGVVQVASAASPGYDAPAAGSGTGATGGGTDGADSASLAAADDGTGLDSSGLGSTGDLGGGSGDSAGGSAGGGSSPTSAAGAGGPGRPTAAVSPVFKGVGAGLVLLGLLGAAALMVAAHRGEALAEAGGGGPCEMEDGEEGGGGSGDPGPPDEALADRPPGS